MEEFKQRVLNVMYRHCRRPNQLILVMALDLDEKRYVPTSWEDNGVPPSTEYIELLNQFLTKVFAQVNYTGQIIIKADEGYLSAEHLPHHENIVIYRESDQKWIIGKLS